MDEFSRKIEEQRKVIAQARQQALERALKVDSRAKLAADRAAGCVAATLAGFEGISVDHRVVREAPSGGWEAIVVASHRQFSVEVGGVITWVPAPTNNLGRPNGSLRMKVTIAGGASVITEVPGQFQDDGTYNVSPDALRRAPREALEDGA